MASSPSLSSLYVPLNGHIITELLFRLRLVKDVRERHDMEDKGKA